MNLENGTKIESEEFRVFWCKKECYVWDVKNNEFSKLTSLKNVTYCSDLNVNNKGLSKEQQILRRIIHGNNEIHIPVKPLATLFAQEVLNPFCVFQLFAIILWLFESYYYYTIVLLIIISWNVLYSALQTRKNQISLRNTMASTETVRVVRNNGMFESISSVQLVPGDIIELPRQRGTIICDAILLDGTCVVNEAELTGESVPVVKNPLPCEDVLYNSKLHSYNTLFCGTTIIQSRNYEDRPVLAKVIKTGLQTAKGTLVISILYPPQSDFKFKEDMRKIMTILCVIGLFQIIYTAFVLSENEIYRRVPQFIVLTTLSEITLVLPASLPVVMMVGVSYARSRLKKKHIYCTDTKAIITSGSVNCICFDKTGTLTEDGLSIMGIIPSTHRMLGYLEKDLTKLKNHPIFQGMLVCHSLVHVDGELMGDVLDLGIFKSTGWQLAEPEKIQEKLVTTIKSPDNNEKIYTIKQYQFSSDLQRMSTIVKSPYSNDLNIYVKGSPEMILKLSKPSSCPQDAFYVLQKYTQQGFRVIAFGCSKLDVGCEQKIEALPREEVEKNLEFLGFILFENKLKSVTKRIIQELRDCNMRVIMITGDNIQTAISVAKECGIVSQEERILNVLMQTNNSNSTKIFFKSNNPIKINPKSNRIKFAITGDIWQFLCKNDAKLLAEICQRGAVFARMTSNQKQQLILELMQLGYNVAMCGDGANDCEALKAAHVGISLSEAESSVASPFVSLTSDISCVTTLIREGRAALVTSFSNFEFTITYALVESISTLILFWIGSCPTNWQFMYIDFFLGLLFGLLFGNTKTYEGKFAKEPPTSCLFSVGPLLSVGSHLFVYGVFQLSVFIAVRHQDWYTPFVKNDRLDFRCYENYSVVSLSYFQYIIIAISFSRGEPYRKPIYTNHLLMIALLITALGNIYLTLWPDPWIIDLFELRMPPEMKWRYIIVGLAFLNFAVCLWMDEIVIKKLQGKIERIIKRMHRQNQVEPKINHQLSIIGKESIDLDKPNNEVPKIRHSYAGRQTATFENRAFLNDVRIKI
ncbi:probable cation-transporting ATPase W08D2.5 isoform X2 [Phymastichus coffea]|nr:probable cation-transporting ATPase W08D2.5 isoform X2 [Phymastichus coffea]XP_058794436.1 probable cation-transporting ATPase W08D2.5 isoform X2 [Phymastichus coffea]